MVTNLFWRSETVGAFSILNDTFKFARTSHLVSLGHLSVWSTDVCICTDASEKSFAFVVRGGCRELGFGGWSGLSADKI